jgi:RHH-type proline utilization regulon transcriptional repressor/proline dehydrogenase/delta 1-pyrroline-5-carboxylate dehydrogenase
VRATHRVEESGLVSRLADEAALGDAARRRALGRARDLVAHIRMQRRKVGNIDALMQEYDLSSAEGVTLMCLAEALLRIPDAATQDAFIEDRLGRGDWASHLGASESFFVNASTFGLMMAGRAVSVDEAAGPAVERIVKRLGEPVIRLAVRRAMRVLGDQFVMGRTIEEALARARPAEAKGYRHSYDMLGEAARTDADAERYFDAYARAIRAVGKESKGRGPVEGPGVSVKLSALHARYEQGEADRVMSELLDRIVALAEIAAAENVGLCVDAEEAERLDLSLDVFEALATHETLKGWDGLGLAVQAYQKRARALLDWLLDLARGSRRRLLVRLVKGAYWDTEIKRAQERGHADYPVFTRKVHTDVCYLACAKAMLEGGAAFYPCFATHNANTLAALIEMAGARRELEFQRLHGMGEALYARVVEGEGAAGAGIACRVYAPVGGHEDLLAYLVRRLLENGANTSFVNRITDDSLPIDEIVRDQVAAARDAGFAPHPHIPRPPELFAPGRRNSAGIDLTDPTELAALRPAMDAADHDRWRAAPVIAGAIRAHPARAAFSPADRTRKVGEVVEATAADARDALAAATAAAAAWDATPAAERAGTLRRASDLFEAQGPALMTLIVREAGRTVADAHLEVREAVDFLRYYAGEAERLFAGPTRLPGPTGEANTLALRGRGPFLCIAPWNFPLAIFTGQVAAALAAGCPALAKPAEQTPLVAAEAVRLLHEAGVPPGALHLLPGDGPTIGDALLGDPRLKGVVFTGSTETAWAINRALAAREGAIIPFIAETGGVNAMIVDSTALPEQVTRDVLASAFQSAGQRCSSLRLLCVQEDVAERQLAMIAGAMAELRVGDPGLLATDVGPIIDEEALQALEAHKAEMARRFKTIAETPRGAASRDGLFLPPVAFAIDRVEDLPKEVFGPILHVVRWKAGALEALIERINGLGYGLTLSLHSRSETRIARVAAMARVGNVYVNRNQIGAVVGVQPFGGEGLSGTGPKAGGPHYLARFAVERTLTVDTTALGGDPSLMTLGG